MKKQLEFMVFIINGFFYDFFSLFSFLLGTVLGLGRMFFRPTWGFLLISFFIVSLAYLKIITTPILILLLILDGIYFFWKKWIKYTTQPEEHKKPRREINEKETFK